MARRNNDPVLLMLLEMLPWPVTAIFAVLLYAFLKWIVPHLQIQDPLTRGFANAAHAFAGPITMLFLMVAGASALREFQRRKRLRGTKAIEDIRRLPWREFEELVAEAFRLRGYDVDHTGRSGPDGGVDVVLRKAGETILVQCKQWREEMVGVKIVRELFGVVKAQGASKGIVISSGVFTEDAKDFARDLPLELINGVELLRMVERVNAAASRPDEVTNAHQSVPQPTHPATPTGSQGANSADMRCPLCGAEMERRVAGKGPRAGQPFWGCSTYPRCKGIING